MIRIEKEAKIGVSNVVQRTYTSSARAAMQHIMKIKFDQDARGILLPSYIGLSPIEGSGVFDPVKAVGMPSAFYRVDERLRPDLIDVQRLLETGDYQLLFLVHYFGCPQADIGKLVRLCADFDVQVIEDCAHSITGGITGSKLGTTGHYSIFSIHKSTASISGGYFLDHVKDVSCVSLLPQHAIDPASLAWFANTDIHGMSMMRIENYKQVNTVIGEMLQVEPFFDEVAVGCVPLNYPIVLPEGTRADLYRVLISHDVLPTALYHTLIPEICEYEFCEAVQVSRNIINLPTHQDITGTMMPKYLEKLQLAFREVYG